MERKEIEKKADEIIKQYNVSTEYGVDIVQLCKDMGFSIIAIDLDETEDGFIIVNSELDSLPGFVTNKVIAVNSKRSYEDKRFIIAHELGHYVLKNDNQNLVAARDSRHGRDDEENDVDFFAACILMPREAFIRKYKDFSSTVEKIGKSFDPARWLASQFDVPIKSARRRMKETKIIDFA